MTACDYVYLNLKGEPGSRAKLPPRKRNALRYRRFLHDVDPCTLIAGHDGAHVLTTMPRVEGPTSAPGASANDAEVME